jgi:hypothetical protein
MNARAPAIAVPARPRPAQDRVVVAAAIAFALLSVLVTWQTLSTTSTGSTVAELEAARQIRVEAPQAPVR